MKTLPPATTRMRRATTIPRTVLPAAATTTRREVATSERRQATAGTSLWAAARSLALLAILAASLFLVACGGSKAGASAAATEEASERQAEVRFQRFAKCLREHGVDAETATMPGGGHGFKVSPGRAQGPRAMEVAQRACARYRPEPKHVSLSPQQKIELEEKLQAFAKCMREHGIKVEVSTAGGGVQIGIHHRADGGPNPESPGFQRAQAACQKLLPGPPGGGPGPKLPPGPGAGGPPPGVGRVKGGEGGGEVGAAPGAGK